MIIDTMNIAKQGIESDSRIITGKINTKNLTAGLHDNNYSVLL